jgi:hypothetical protein
LDWETLHNDLKVQVGASYGRRNAFVRISNQSRGLSKIIQDGGEGIEIIFKQC